MYTIVSRDINTRIVYTSMQVFSDTNRDIVVKICDSLNKKYPEDQRWLKYITELKPHQTLKIIK